MRYFHCFQLLSSFLVLCFFSTGNSKISTIKTSRRNKCNNYSKALDEVLKGVCVCNSTSCDRISDKYRYINYTEAILYETDYYDENRLEPTKLSVILAPNSSYIGNNFVIKLNESIHYQSIIGFGGAFTDATATNIYRMNHQTQDQIVSSYFGVDNGGLEYTLGRIPIASTDFSEHVYSYNDLHDDFQMKNFSIDVDKEPNSHKLSFIQRVINMTAGTDKKITFFASSWAPPKWMTKEKRVENCHMIGYPGRSKYWKALALYYSRFITEYEKEGVTIWALTTQNEPIQEPSFFSQYQWQSLRFTSGEMERDFIKYDLGPVLQESNHSHVKIFIMDDQRSKIKKWTKAILEDPDAMKYNVHGIGIHWYSNVDYALDPIIHTGHYGYLDQIHEANPNLLLLATEACEGYLPKHIGTGSGVKLTNPTVQWQRAENYARDIVNDLNHWVGGWTDWNLVLNFQGGPNWAKNFVDAPIIADVDGGEEFYKQPMYYIMGHFSKFLPPGSKRIHYDLLFEGRKKNHHSESVSLPKKVGMAAFTTPENKIVIIVYNRDAKTSYPFTIQLSNDSRQISFVSKKKSVQTIILLHDNNNNDNYDKDQAQPKHFFSNNDDSLDRNSDIKV